MNGDLNPFIDAFLKKKKVVAGRPTRLAAGGLSFGPARAGGWAARSERGALASIRRGGD